MASLQDRQEGIIVKLFDLVHEADSYSPPTLNVGDRILKGKFKNSPAEITGFTRDKHNQPVLKTNRGEVQLFKPRVTKLMDKDVAEGLQNIEIQDDKSIVTISVGGKERFVLQPVIGHKLKSYGGGAYKYWTIYDIERKKDRFNPNIGMMSKNQAITYVNKIIKREEDAAKVKPGVVEGFLNEGLSHPVIVVDVQPEYSGMNDGDESSVFPQIINFVNKQTGPVLMFVNAEDQGLSGDTIQDIKQYWDDTICPEEERYTHDEETDDYIENPNCPKINWQRFAIADKGYGYFRSWMDHGIEPATIVATIRELYQQKKSDSRELQFPAFNKRTPQQSLIMGAMQEMEDDPISVNWTSVSQLKRFNGAYIVGGARDQCLREVELLMNAFNIKYKRIDSLIYEGQQGVAEGTEEVNPLTNAVISFYKPVVDQIEPGAVDDYVKQAKELLNQAPDPTIRSRMLEIFRKGQKDPMIQGGVITAIAAILTGGLLSSASRMGLSPAQTNILLQAVLNTVIPTIIARINNKSWRDTIKYTLASVGVGMTAAATLSEKRVTKVASNTIPTMGINIRSDGNIDYASLIVDGEKKYESRKTDSLRPYVGKIVGIVRTGNGPAVAIGQVTIGEPIVVDVEKFNRLRKQHLVPQGSKFDIDSDGTKYLYPMINPVRWDNEKPIKHRGIVSRKIQEQGVTEGLSIDVPNEEWLQDKIDYAKSKGRDEWGAPFFGSTTAYVRPDTQVSVVRLELLKGMRNEQNNVRKTDLEWLMATMEKTGKLPLTKRGEEYAPYVMVAYNGEAWVNEGNHRIMAAYRLGWKKMPIEIKYFDGGERVESGIMYPGKIGLGRPAANPVREAYTGPQLKWLKPGELRGSYTDQQMRDRGFNQTGTGKWFILLSRWNELIAKKGIQ